MPSLSAAYTFEVHIHQFVTTYFKSIISLCNPRYDAREK